MTRTGRYEIISRIGPEPPGTLYKAADRVFNRVVTLKIVPFEGPTAGGASPDEPRLRLWREAQLLAQLKHPNIVTVYDIALVDDVVCMAMEFLDGVGLDRLIARGQLAVERAAAIGAQVADALDFVHRRNVIHRNIQPACIIVLQDDRVTITDFSIATVIKSAEQGGDDTVDGRSDLFSLGCTLYEMVTGRKAFHAESTTNLILKVIIGKPPRIRALNPAVPKEMVRIIEKAMAKAPEARYQSGRELAHDLLAL